MAVVQNDQKSVLFIRGAGDGAYEADAKLVASLREALGATYSVRYPQMPDEDATTEDWIEEIGKAIDDIESSVILVAHSFGASAVVKYLAETEVRQLIAGIFLIATPFWGGEEGWQYEGFTIVEDFADRLPKDIPIFLYHNRDDSDVPFAHLALYAAKLPGAIIHEGESGGHQFGDDLTQVARDIQGLH